MAKKKAAKVEKPKPNLPALKSRYIEARNAWLAALDARGIDMYADAAEGKEIGRGKARGPDDLRKLYDAQEAARLAWLGGGA